MMSRVALAVMGIIAIVALLGLVMVRHTPTGAVVGQVPALLRCSDTDGGLIPWTKGTVHAWADNRNLIVGEDVCYGAFDVYEFYCRTGMVQSVIVGCPPTTQCAQGACA